MRYFALFLAGLIMGILGILFVPVNVLIGRNFTGFEVILACLLAFIGAFVAGRTYSLAMEFLRNKFKKRTP